MTKQRDRRYVFLVSNDITTRVSPEKIVKALVTDIGGSFRTTGFL